MQYSNMPHNTCLLTQIPSQKQLLNSKAQYIKILPRHHSYLQTASKDDSQVGRKGEGIITHMHVHTDTHHTQQTHTTYARMHARTHTHTHTHTRTHTHVYASLFRISLLVHSLN